MNWLLVLVILVGSLTPVGSRATAAGDKTGVLTNLTPIVTQGGKPITGNDKIDSNLPIEVRASFGIPVLGDGVPNVVDYLDTAVLELSEKFSLLSGTSIELRTGEGDLVGHVTLITDPSTKKIRADIQFDGDQDVFTNPGNNGVSAWFDARLQYDSSNGDDVEGDHQVAILNKTFTVVVPPKEIVYEVKKDGVVNPATQTVKWTVEVSATQGTYSLDLKNYVLLDNLTNVGEYLPGSFEVNGNVISPDPVTGNAIQYTFPDQSMSPITVTFETKIPEDKYYSNYSQSIDNTAQLLKDSVSVKDGYKSVTITPPKWIEKTGKAENEKVNGVYDPSNRVINWTITANFAKATINNLTIKDVLPPGLSFGSAKWETSTDGTTWTHHSDVSSLPAGSEYKLSGPINEMARLIITSKVDDTNTTTGTKTFNNSATVDWDEKPDGVANPGAGPIGVSIGYNAISKTGTLDKTNRVITWKINVDAQGQAIPNMTVYDLLVYDKSINLSTVTGIPTGIAATDLTPKYGLKYVADSYSGLGTVKVHEIKQGGTRVADLLEITNTNGLSTTTPHILSFNTLVTDPDVFAGNKDSDVTNTASLFTGTTKLNEATGHVNFDSRTLGKELLKREALLNPSAGVNDQRTSNASEGFDYTDKSAIFRLSINADGLDFSSVKNAADEVLGAATITDTLPVGWEFTEIVPGQNYLIFEGKAGAGSSVEALDTTPDTVAGLSADFTEAGKATFTMNPLTKPYVILVKAKPTTVTLKGYFNGNKTTPATNNLKLTADKWTNGVGSNQSVSIKSEIVKKEYAIPQPGILNWTVEYNPYALAEVGEKIEDTLPPGIELRTDSMGVLLLDDISAKELILQENGTLVEGSVVPLVLDDNVFYNNTTRVLTFVIPDTSKAYRFTYLTDITGSQGPINNQARLSRGGSSPVSINAGYQIMSADGAATMNRSGWLEITKTVGQSNAPLAGAEFKLYSSDESVVIREGISDANGKLRFLALPVGDYLLRETSAPAGYKGDSTTWNVSVTRNGKTVSTSIDSKTGTDSNKLTVANYQTGTVGDLSITKNVVGNGGSKTKKFTFTVTFTGAPGSYNYIGSNGAASGTISSGGTIQLADGQSVVIKDLPKDAEYTVTEADYSVEGYITGSTDDTGKIESDQTKSAEFINTKDIGSLVIKKVVDGNGGDVTKKFEFTVTLTGAPGSYDYVSADGTATGTISSGGTIELAHGESIMISGLPKGAKYTVTEDDYSTEGYVTTSNGASGTITLGNVQIAEFTNTNYKPGNLRISKTVAGNDGDLTKKFRFTVTFNGANGSYSYMGTGGASNGTIRSGDVVELAHAESILITGLPKDAGYTVTEADYSADEYGTASIGDTGTIVSDDTQTAAFTNTKDKPGNLVISKSVNGNAADRSKLFDFTVTFSSAGTYNYTGAGGAADGTISSGDTISLAHGQSISIAGLPKDTVYTVTEADYSAHGYATTSTGETGKIVTDAVQNAAFVNTRNVFVPGPGPWPGPSQPVDPSSPDKEKEEKPDIEEPGTEQPDPDQPSPEVSNQGDNGGDDDGGAVNNETVTDDENKGNKDGNVLGESDAAQGGTPKTGDTSFKQMAQFGLIFFLLALAGLFWADSVLRKRRTNSN